MKKLLTMLLTVLLIFSFTACGGNKEDTTSKNSNKEMESKIQQIQKNNSTSKKNNSTSKKPAESIKSESTIEFDVESVDESKIESEVTEENSESQESESVSVSEPESNELSTDFIEAMDAYEAFYDEYCELIVEYSKNPTDLTLLTEYSEMLQKTLEMDEKFEKWDEEDLNDAELKYYLEVNNRVMQKILDAESKLIG